MAFLLKSNSADCFAWQTNICCCGCCCCRCCGCCCYSFWCRSLSCSCWRRRQLLLYQAYTEGKTILLLLLLLFIVVAVAVVVVAAVVPVVVICRRCCCCCLYCSCKSWNGSSYCHLLPLLLFGVLLLLLLLLLQQYLWLSLVTVVGSLIVVLSPAVSILPFLFPSVFDICYP